MSEDPETARQIAELSLDNRPLLVLDVDDVLLEFVRPFTLYLDAQGLELSLKTFRLHGNISIRKTGEALDRERVSALIDAFFAAQATWQSPLDGAVEAIAGLAGNAEIVMLTAMPHRHRATRRAHLDGLGFPYPLLTTETAKGPAIRALRGATARPVAFVDDIPHNLVSVRAAVSEAHLFHLMAVPSMRSLLPPRRKTSRPSTTGAKPGRRSRRRWASDRAASVAGSVRSTRKQAARHVRDPSASAIGF